MCVRGWCICVSGLCGVGQWLVWLCGSVALGGRGSCGLWCVCCGKMGSGVVMWRLLCVGGQWLCLCVGPWRCVCVCGVCVCGVCVCVVCVWCVCVCVCVCVCGLCVWCVVCVCVCDPWLCGVCCCVWVSGLCMCGGHGLGVCVLRS
ncbi:hypothetical protein FKM82_030663 [Ascaphus truei]